MRTTMSVGRRIAMLFRIKANKALDRAEDPREVLDYSYERQLEMLTKVRRGVADVATSRKRLDLQLGQLQQSADRLQTQAAQAVEVGRDALAGQGGGVPDPQGDGQGHLHRRRGADPHR